MIHRPADHAPTPLLLLPHRHTRNLLFAPDNQIVIGFDGTWLAFDLRAKTTTCLPVRGTHATFFGRWLVVRDASRDETFALEWPPHAAPLSCDIGFDIDYMFRTGAVAAASSTVAAFVRDGRLCVRKGSPDTLDDAKGWTHHGEFSSNVRLLCSNDGRYVVGCNAGMNLDVFDTAASATKKIPLRNEGHPVWVAMHPSQPVVAVFSRVLEVADLASGIVKQILQLPKKPAGEYLPDGTLLFTTEAGVQAWSDGQPRMVLETPYQEDQPLRVSPDGRLVVIPGADLAVFSVSSLMRSGVPST